MKPFMIFNNMKTIYRLLLLASASVLFGCQGLNQMPEFNSDESFAAFDVTSLSISEKAGRIKIPVTIASIEPVNTTVSYSIVDGGTAKQGENFNLVDAAAVVKYDGGARTNYIEIDIINIPGYTGDFNFKLQLVNAVGLKLGANRFCDINIKDEDHPLAELLGEYTVKGTTEDDGETSWDLLIEKLYINKEKTQTSVTAVKVYGISPWLAGKKPYPAFDNGYVANVVFNDEKKITGLKIDIGQSLAFKFPYKGTDYDILIGTFEKTAAGISVNIESGSIDLTWKDNVVTVETNIYVGLTIGWLDCIYSGATWTKK